MSPPPHDDRDRPGRHHANSSHQPPAADNAPALVVVLAAAFTAPARARDRVAEWLRALGWPLHQAEDLVFAVNEAVSNSVEHGYRLRPGEVAERGTVDVFAEIHDSVDGTRCVVVTVKDGGRWRESDGPAGYRSRGLAMMRATVDALVVVHDASGTTVEMRSCLS